MRFGQNPQAVLRATYPALFAVLKSGGWRYNAGAIEIADGVWAGLSPALQADAEAWADACGVRSPATERREAAIAGARNIGELIAALKRG